MKSRARIVLALVAVTCGCGGAASSDPGPRWQSSSPAAPGGTSPTAAGAKLDVVVVNEPGEQVDLAAVLVPGKITVVDFFAVWCGPCREVDRRLRTAMTKEESIVVRKVDIGEDGQTPVARQHGVAAVPHVLIFDRAGVLRYTLPGRKARQAAEIAQHMAQEDSSGASKKGQEGAADQPRLISESGVDHR